MPTCSFCTKPLRGERDQQITTSTNSMISSHREWLGLEPSANYLAKKYTVSRRSEVVSNTLCPGGSRLAGHYRVSRDTTFALNSNPPCLSPPHPASAKGKTVPGARRKRRSNLGVQTICQSDLEIKKPRDKTRRTDYRVCTFNCRSLSSDDRLAELLEETRRIQFDVIGLCETKRAAEAHLIHQDGTGVFLGKRNESSVSGGVGFIVQSTLLPKIVEIRFLSHRIGLLTFKVSRKFNCTVIQVYAPTADSDLEEICDFYDSVVDVFRECRIRTMPNSCKEFSISENVKNISRFVDGERYHTNLEDRFNIPWRIRIEKTNDNFQLYLRCEKEECENRKWSIETEITLKLVSHNGKSLMKNWKYTFAKPTGRGFEFISWKELESDYVVDDSIVVEAHVKILNILDSPCTETMNQKTFMLNHTVQNVSNIKERGIYTTNVETHYNIPWRIEIQRREGFFGMYLQCEKKHFDSKDWSIEVELVLTLKSSNGQRLSFTASSTLNEPASYGYDKLIRWDDMERKYAVNDSIIIEARVKIIKMTGFEERPPVGRLSGIVIPVGDREYSMEEWMEMAFGC